MMNGLLIGMDAIFIGMMIFNLYWQSQIIVYAKYKISSLFVALFFAVWVLSAPIHSWSYIVMVAAFLTLAIMQGTGGIGKKKLVTNGFFASVLDYKNIEHITLIPVDLPSQASQVISVFTTSNNQNIQMTFKKSVNEIQTQLRQLIPSSTTIEITKVY